MSGCASDASNTLTYTLKPKPVTPAITGNVNAKFNTDEVYAITTTAGSSYNWTVINGTPSAGGSPGTINVKWGTSPTGNVSVKETGSNGCIGDAQNLAITLTPNTGLPTVGFVANINVFPNPMNDVLSISFNQGSSYPTQIRIVNMLGQTVAEESVKTLANGYTQTLDVSKLIAGVYFIEINNREGSKQFKILKK